MDVTVTVWQERPAGAHGFVGRAVPKLLTFAVFATPAFIPA
jgi:hypothetical protein